jgi:hypothetical protein
MEVTEIRRDLRLKLLEMDAQNFSDEELDRVFQNVTLPEYCISEIKKARDAGITMDDINMHHFMSAMELSYQAVLAERSGDAELIEQTRAAVITAINEMIGFTETDEKPRSRLKME